MRKKTRFIDLFFPLRQFIGAVLFFSSAKAAADDWWLSLSDVDLRNCVADLAQQRGWHQREDVDEIQCHGKAIRDLTGLAPLPRLRKLSLYNNQLNAVTLSAFPQLQHLNLARNKIQQLRLSDLPQLSELLCFDNALTQFELHDLPRLNLLKANANKMRFFSYDALPQLEKIYLFNNQLATIDINHLPGLRYMDVRQNPMPDELYQRMDAQKNVTYLHDGNAPDWK